VGETIPNRQFMVTGELRKRIKEAFDDQGNSNAGDPTYCQACWQQYERRTGAMKLPWKDRKFILLLSAVIAVILLEILALLGIHFPNALGSRLFSLSSLSV
jgi:hypothetical protein